MAIVMVVVYFVGGHWTFSDDELSTMHSSIHLGRFMRSSEGYSTSWRVLVIHCFGHDGTYPVAPDFFTTNLSAVDFANVVMDLESMESAGLLCGLQVDAKKKVLRFEIP